MLPSHEVSISTRRDPPPMRAAMSSTSCRDGSLALSQWEHWASNDTRLGPTYTLTHNETDITGSTIPSLLFYKKVDLVVPHCLDDEVIGGCERRLSVHNVKLLPYL